MNDDEKQDVDSKILCYSVAAGWQLELVVERDSDDNETESCSKNSENLNITEGNGRVVVCTLRNFTGKVVMVPTQQPSQLKSTASTSSSSKTEKENLLAGSSDNAPSASLTKRLGTKVLSVETTTLSDTVGNGGVVDFTATNSSPQVGGFETVFQGNMTGETTTTSSPDTSGSSSAIHKPWNAFTSTQQEQQRAASGVASPATSAVSHDASSITRVPSTSAATTPASNGTSGSGTSSQWGLFLRVDQARRALLPSPMRRAREAARKNNSHHNATNTTPTTVPAFVPPPTRLHQLCAESFSLSSKHSTKKHARLLQEALAQEPYAASTLDARGRTPLHILGDNDSWIATSPLTASTFGLSLIQANPAAINLMDTSEQRMPFVGLLEEWCIWVYQTHLDQKNSKSGAIGASAVKSTNRSGDGVSDSIVTNTLAKGKGLVEGANALLTHTVDYIRTAAAGGADDLESNHQHLSQGTGALVGTGRATRSLVKPAMAKSSAQLYPRVEVWEEVEFCFGMLSLEMDELGGKNGGLHQTENGRKLQELDVQARSELATHIVQVIPTIFKTVMLIDDRDCRRRLLKMSIFRRLLLVPESVGPWLTHMLHRKGIPAKRAVDFLELVSATTVEDYVGEFRTVMQADIIEFEQKKKEVFEAMEGLQSTITSLVVLENRDIDRAAACSAAWHIMEKNLARPFVVGILLIDFVLHVTLMLAVREDVLLKHRSLGALEDVPTSVAMFICAHYIVRKIAEAMSLFNLSWSVFQSYFANIWTILDFTTIISTLIAVSWNKSNPNQYRNGFNAFVVGLLWFKMLGFLKVVNKHMSTFIMAVFQILRDLKYFAIVLIVIVCQMGDMMSIAVSTKDNGEFCKSEEVEDDSTIQDFCSSDRTDSYLRVWSLLLGDFDLDAFKETKGLTALFSIFTVIGVIILLNVLIAIISDSYERAKIRSAKLFGRARVTFVAQNEALEVFLRPGTDPLKILNLESIGSPRKAVVCAMHVFRWLVLLTLIITAMAAEVFLVSRAIASVRSGIETGIYFVLLSILLAVLLSAALWVVVVFMLDGVRAHCSPRLVRLFDLCNRGSQCIVELVASRIFGVRKKSNLPNGDTHDDTDDHEEEWNGRMDHIEQMLARALLETRENVRSEIEGLEKRLREQQALVAHTNNAGY